MAEFQDLKSRWTRVEKIIFGVGLAMGIAILCTLPWTGQVRDCVALYAIYTMTPFLIPQVVWRRFGGSKSTIAAGGMKTYIVGSALFMPMTALVMTGLYVVGFRAFHPYGPTWSRIASVLNHSFAVCLSFVSVNISTRKTQQADAAIHSGGDLR
jgi:hypothetical protein